MRLLGSYLLVGLVCAFVATGCSSKSDVGAVCTADDDCGFGLQCFRHSEDLDAVCTVGCASGSCDSGHCVTTAYGAICASGCEFAGDCPGDLSCQTDASDARICWFPDEHLEPVPSGLTVESARLTADTNNDGILNPGETAVLEFYPTNASMVPRDGVWAELVAADTTVTVTTCMQPAFPHWLPCSAACSCGQLDASTRQSVQGLSTSTEPVLQMGVVLSPETPPGTVAFKLRLHSDSGESWESIVSVPVIEQQVAVVVHSADVVSEENGDGLLSPGEEATVHVTVANYGVTQVKGLYAVLGVTDPAVDVLSCGAPVGTTAVSCDLKCDCSGVPVGTKQTLQPAEVASSPIFEVRFRVAEGAAPGPLPFGLSFQDELGNSWSSAFTVEVAPDEASVVLDHTEILEDANGDGYLSPAESASVQIFARNAGNSKAVDVWAELVVADPRVTLSSCKVGVGAGWAECSASCSCESAPASGRQNLGPGETGTVAILVIEFEVASDASFDPLEFQIRFHDGLGNSWLDSFQEQIFSPDAEIEVASVSLLDDANSDGFLSPAEDATIEIFARNVGTSRALAVYAAVSDYSDTIIIDSCYTKIVTGWELCSVNCSCGEIPDGLKQNIESMKSGAEPILQVNFHLLPEAELVPVTFDVTFYDSFGNSWTDTFDLDVVAVKANIQVESVQLWGDSNGDGILTPGESAKVQVYAKNSGIAKTFGVYAQLTQTDVHVNVATCYAEVEDTWAKCDSACNCEGISSIAKQSLEPGDHGSESILRVNFDLDTNAPAEPITFNLTFHDLFGNQWEDTFILDVETYAAELGVGFITLLTDTNGDGYLSPGEEGSVLVYPKNDGTVKALGVWAQLMSIEPGVSVTNCYAGIGGGDPDAWAKCSADCSCAGLFTSALQDLEAEQTSALPILKMDVALDPAVAVGSLSFGIGFTDNLGLLWNDVMVLEVITPDVDLGVGLTQVQSDTSDDGALSPGENMTLDVYANNEGTTIALGVWARFISPTPHIVLSACYASSDNNTVSCTGLPDGGCTCEAIPSVMKPDIEPNGVTDEYVLRIGFELAAGAPVGVPIPLQFQFIDSFGNVHDDAFTLDVVAPPETEEEDP